MSDTTDITADDVEALDWSWPEAQVACPHCGAALTIHEQPPGTGTTFECHHCDGKFWVGDLPAAPDPRDVIVECGQCHRTFSAAEVEPAADSVWTCPEDGTENRYVAAGETGTGVVKGGAS